MNGIEPARELLRQLGLPQELLEETAARYVKAMREMTQGYSQSAADVLQVRFPVDSPPSLSRHGCTSIVSLCPIRFGALCEHHALPFYGVAKIAYVPSKDETGHRRVIGLSKMVRLVRVFAERFTMQEKIGEEVVHALMEFALSEGAMAILRARHSCVCNRGVRDGEAEATTFFCAGSLDVGRPLHVTATKILDPSLCVPL